MSESGDSEKFYFHFEMSASGPKRTFHFALRMSAFRGIAEIEVKGLYFRF